MKIALVGKGGSGKTTVASLLTRHLTAAGAPVLAIDADINQHLPAALGFADGLADGFGNGSADGLADGEPARLPALGEHLTELKDYLRGDNPRIPSAEAMVKTTPPGRGSRLVRIVEENPIYAKLSRRHEGIRLMVTGQFADDDLGVACYHSKVGAVELLLNHLVDGPGEYAVVDMTAGAESFASGIFTRFDQTFLVCEPTKRSVGVWRQYTGYAAEFGVRIGVIGNKVEEPADIEFLREHVGEDLLCWLTRSPYVKAAERGTVRPIAELEPANRAALERLRTEVDAVEKDWPRYQRQAVEFHLRNAEAWGNARTGVDLSEQVDPDFIPGPAAVAVGSR